ncbi:hypothetical protein BJV78DRAFT_1284831 [Lactifluus subvellereus]|nr:hypothetical protein BJV78DRAFT_1284831 [Lactifluus subvellereus]
MPTAHASDFSSSSSSSSSLHASTAIAMVALVATAVYAVLYEWKTGARVIIKFEGNIFATI